MLPAVDRLDEVIGIGREAAQAIIVEIGLHMRVFPTSGHLVSWAKVSPQTVQSGARNRADRTGKGNPYLKGILGDAAAAGKTDTSWGTLPAPGPGGAASSRPWSPSPAPSW